MNNRMILVDTKDYANRESRKTRFLYETVQDTLIKRIFNNEKLLTTIKTVSSDNQSTEYRYSLNNKLEKTIEEFKVGKDSLISVEKSFSDNNSIDSTVYVKGKEVKNILYFSDRIRVTVMEYDSRNNIKREVINQIINYYP